MKFKLRLIVAVSAAALTLTACSSSSDDKAAKPASPDASQGTATKLVEISPLTGKALRKGRPDNPVFVVKIENTSAGAPQYGLDKADLVMEELVEGGLTRLAAFFYSSLPTKVGHVRSLRTSDIGIAGPVGGQIVASGGATGAYNKVKNAGITVFSEDAGSPGFSSDPAKYRPYNRLIDLKVVAKKAKRTKIKGPYLPWSPADAAPAPATGKTATAATVRFSPATSTGWKLDGRKWVRTNGHAAPNKDFKADTMIVVFAKVGNAGYTDPAGNPVPETVFEGKGEAMVFHGNQVDTVTWRKPSLDEALTFTAKDGTPYTIAPGKTFIELVPQGAGSVTLG
ncbi:DUF3048 domain-containing protein [Aeromicrobium wangtongii]|uniref:DUF3048 domain-containing protein n=1 Tax=Aeromicrobium wangtongii TaxID=2969247 RepID=A0ABY5M9Y6_9ACTN|nr:DUF3048 domain-containing protein [Aeromicrobium wangtongii]MCD9197135.1 DUF3048 domain-containing protein [Aeromicrobium wangtongii]UUP14632.1 DUF3048 domain-containing protein [Aeromicrobium wangtongii]